MPTATSTISQNPRAALNPIPTAAAAMLVEDGAMGATDWSRPAARPLQAPPADDPTTVFGKTG